MALTDCLCSGERGERVGPPHFLLLIAWQPVGGLSSNLAHVCSNPGEIF